MIYLNGLMNYITPTGLNIIMNKIIYNNISPLGLQYENNPEGMKLL
jgi:hypothetical protein